MDINKCKKIHFAGIGGIGMSALARMMLSKGIEVSGSDRSPSEITSALESEGVYFFKSSDEVDLSGTDVLIYTPALSDNHPELRKARSLEIPTLSYPEALGEVSSKMRTVAISGTHGKTTTTAMATKILKDSGKEPTAIVGSIVSEYGSNFISGETGKDSIFVVEACEYKRSFLNLSPEVLIITNIEADHLDYYKDIEEIIDTFAELISKVKKGGIIIGGDDENTKEAYKLSGSKNKFINYKDTLNEIPKLKIPGRHNIENAKAALSATLYFEVDMSLALKSLGEFSGTWRRFEYKGETSRGVRVFDDYAHHPQEIKASIETAKSAFPGKKINVVFEPHLHSRTKVFFDDLIDALSKADNVILAPIYAAREENKENISSDDLALALSKKISNTSSLEKLEDASNAVSGLGDNDVLIMMGAGDIYTQTPKVLEN